MSLKKGVYIIECVPQKEDKREGKLIYEFLNMFPKIKKKIEFCQVKGKTDFFDTLYENNSKVVHISCHGDTDNKGNFYMIMPKGEIYPSEFYENNGLKGRNVVITGCLLGHADFAKEFLKTTQAESLIAPKNDITFPDSAMWCVNFYYHLLTRNSFSFRKSYNYMDEKFYILGAMKIWPITKRA